jgi:diguanylate cyclase (GGDEF)-like protein
MGIIARAVLERKAMIINDMKNDPRANENHRAGHLERGTQSLAVFPLIVSDAVAGVFLLHATEYGFFDDEEVKLLSELSENIGFALQTIDSKVKLDYLSRYDPVTGLPNRVLFSDRIAQFALLQKTGCVALIVFNIVRFRNINESFGRTGGDKILSLVAKRLEAEFNGKNLIARIGSDNFGVIALGIDDAASAARVVENKVLACFNNEFHLNDSELRLTANAGIAIFPDDGSDADTLIKNAEVAQKQANAGKDRFMFYSPAPLRGRDPDRVVHGGPHRSRRSQRRRASGRLGHGRQRLLLWQHRSGHRPADAGSRWHMAEATRRGGRRPDPRAPPSRLARPRGRRPGLRPATAIPLERQHLRANEVGPIGR